MVPLNTTLGSVSTAVLEGSMAGPFENKVASSEREKHKIAVTSQRYYVESVQEKYFNSYVQEEA